MVLIKKNYCDLSCTDYIVSLQLVLMMVVTVISKTFIKNKCYDAIVNLFLHYL